jgi:hypothetical protein
MVAPSSSVLRSVGVSIGGLIGPDIGDKHDIDIFPILGCSMDFILPSNGVFGPDLPLLWEVIGILGE